MRLPSSVLRRLLPCALAVGVCLASAPAAGAADRDLLFSLGDGNHLQVTSAAFDRAEVAPVVKMIGAFPHGAELSELSLDVATPGEVTRRCGEAAIACYDPREDQIVVDGLAAGESETAIVAHEYGHHIANSSTAGIWSAFEAGTLRWSTYEEVCERTRAGELFPGNEGAHYWENPGEAFAQSYATLVEPAAPWEYTPLLEPDETALRKIREDVVDPVHPRELRWQVGGPVRGGDAIGDAVPVGRAVFAKTLSAPYDGRVEVHLDPEEGGRYRLSLLDASTGEVLARARPAQGGATVLHYADCGHRTLEARAEAVGAEAAFTAEIDAP